MPIVRAIIERFSFISIVVMVPTIVIHLIEIVIWITLITFTIMVIKVISLIGVSIIVSHLLYLASFLD